MEERPRSGSDRRSEPRHVANIPITFIGGPTRRAGVCLDLSNEGLLVELESETHPPEGELVRVEVVAPDTPPLLLTVLVMRVVGRKMGLKLFGVSGDPQRRWCALVTKFARDAATR